MPTYDWGLLDGAAPATTGVDVSYARLDRQNRWLLMGQVHPWPLGISFKDSVSTTNRANIYRGLVERDCFLTHISLGLRLRGATGSTRIDVLEGDSVVVSSGTITSSGSGGSPFQVESNHREPFAGGSILSINTVMGAGSTGQADLCGALFFFPGKVLFRFKAPVAFRIEEFEMMGAANANSGATDLTLRRNGTTITGGSLSATPSGNVFETRSTISATNGDFDTTDEMTVQLDNVSDGLRRLSFRVFGRTAVIP